MSYCLSMLALKLIVFSRYMTQSEGRTFYITPDDNSSSQVSSPADHYYSLKDVFSNQSIFLDTNTVLELISGRYDIPEGEHQLVITNVRHFTLNGTTDGSAIICQPSTTFKITFRNVIDAVISKIMFKHCCVALVDSTNIMFNEIKIIESTCSSGLSVHNTEDLQLVDLIIAYSYYNILTVDDAEIRISFFGTTSFIANNGSIVFGTTNAIFNDFSCMSGYYRNSISFNSIVLFAYNIARQHESIFLISGSSVVYFEEETIFINNRGRQGGAISAYSSTVYFNNSARFIGNSADNGGAISLKEGSILEVHRAAKIIMTENKAKDYGGAIYVEETGLWTSTCRTEYLYCFVVVRKYEYYNTVEFENNIAGLAGMQLFGGWIDICIPISFDARPSSVFTFRTSNSTDYTLSEVSSNPSRVCMCTNSTPDIRTTTAYVTTLPGQIFEINVLVVGQQFGVVPAVVRADIEKEYYNAVIDDLQELQLVGTQCTPLKYAIQSQSNKVSMLLHVHNRQVPKPDPDMNVYPPELLQLRVIVTLKECSLGFEFDPKQNICVCHHLLLKRGVTCNIESQLINRNAQQWIFASSTLGIVIHQHCPFDYCKSQNIHLNLSVPSNQCAFNRSGILCGACQSGLSHVLGTANCMKCSNIWLLLILPFAISGVALVMCLMVLNLTVSTGTINGLIFYANIVRANTATFFPGQSANTFFSWFIAWLNLDLGIETCFYDGLNSHVKTWLQFAFPFYIWLLVTTVIISSHYFTRAARIFGNNSVPVLATLFFLSYSKLLRVTITIFQPLQLVYNENNAVEVWQYDGNVDYLGREHTPLFVAALSFLFLLFIPYTLILFGIQWIQPFSHYKVLFWVNKLKPLFDAYTGPYKDKHRYWIGLLLLLRIGLFMVFSANTVGNSGINLLAVNVTVACLIVYYAFLGGVYKQWPLNLLECFFLLNLLILSAGTLFALSSERHISEVSKLSVSIALLFTGCIVFYHCSLRILRSYKRSKLRERVSNVYQNFVRHGQLTNKDSEQCDFQPHQKVTHSVVELT